MLRQILNAFENDEVSFPPADERGVLINMRAGSVANYEFDSGTMIKYHHNFNNISFLAKGGKQLQSS